MKIYVEIDLAEATWMYDYIIAKSSPGDVHQERVKDLLYTLVKAGNEVAAARKVLLRKEGVT